MHEVYGNKQWGQGRLFVYCLTALFVGAKSYICWKVGVCENVNKNVISFDVLF